jgi:hypothetical protein
MNLKRRVEKLEKVKGVGNSPAVLIVKYISPANPEPFTPEETAALDDYRKKVEAEPLAEGAVAKVIFWSRQKAQKLLALAEMNKI